MSLTSLLRPYFIRSINDRYDSYINRPWTVQERQLMALLTEAEKTSFGRDHGFSEITDYQAFRSQVPLHRYEDLRQEIMKMVNGTPDVLWPGRIDNFAQSSGTSDGKSKYIPISKESFRRCHYKGAQDCVAYYLRMNPLSRIFDGRSFILGGSFATELHPHRHNVKIGDLSANLIDRINPLVNLIRIPDKRTALMADWQQKLPALVEASRHQRNITNISGVPSWFLSVIKEVLKAEGKTNLQSVWPELEVFFHGGISFKPYREQYEALTDPARMHFVETYNASEGFFAVQSSWNTKAMLLLLDIGVFYEFIPLSETTKEHPATLTVADVTPGNTYELVISSCNGLWRYRIGDTVRVESVNPLKITVAGRTKHFINAFGEEVMVYNTDEAVTAACRTCNAAVKDYTVAPIFATATTKGRHEWLIEFDRRPDDLDKFADVLDKELQHVNSDYEAKRSGNLFIERPSIVVARKGLFDDWLLATSGKLGGQRKIPRLSNNRDIIDRMLEFNG